MDLIVMVMRRRRMVVMATMTTAIKAADAGIEFSAVDASVRQKMD